MASDKPAKNQISEFYQQAMKHAPDVGMPLFTTIQLRHTHEPIFRTTLKLPGVQHPLISFEEQAYKQRKPARLSLQQISSHGPQRLKVYEAEGPSKKKAENVAAEKAVEVLRSLDLIPRAPVRDPWQANGMVGSGTSVAERARSHMERGLATSVRATTVDPLLSQRPTQIESMTPTELKATLQQENRYLKEELQGERKRRKIAMDALSWSGAPQVLQRLLPPGPLPEQSTVQLPVQPMAEPSIPLASAGSPQDALSAAMLPVLAATPREGFDTSASGPVKNTVQAGKQHTLAAGIGSSVSCCRLHVVCAI
eukprot:jgi/Astpho2/9133/Aster-08385